MRGIVLFLFVFIVYQQHVSCFWTPPTSLHVNDGDLPKLCLWDNCGFCEDGDPFTNPSLNASDFLIYRPSEQCYGPGQFNSSILPPPLTCISGSCPAPNGTFLVGNGTVYAETSLTDTQAILGIECLSLLCANSTLTGQVPVYDSVTEQYYAGDVSQILGVLTTPTITLTTFSGAVLAINSTVTGGLSVADRVQTWVSAELEVSDNVTLTNQVSQINFTLSEAASLPLTFSCIGTVINTDQGFSNALNSSSTPAIATLDTGTTGSFVFNGLPASVSSTGTLWFMSLTCHYVS